MDRDRDVSVGRKGGAREIPRKISRKISRKTSRESARPASGRRRQFRCRQPSTAAPMRALRTCAERRRAVRPAGASARCGRARAQRWRPPPASAWRRHCRRWARRGARRRGRPTDGRRALPRAIAILAARALLGLAAGATDFRAGTTPFGIFATRTLARGIEAIQRGTRDAALDQLLDIDEQALVARLEYRQRVAAGTGTARAADPVHVILGAERQVEVDHAGHVGNIQPARSHIGGDQRVDGAVLEAFERLHALGLGLVTVDGGGVDALALRWRAVREQPILLLTKTMHWRDRPWAARCLSRCTTAACFWPSSTR